MAATQDLTIQSYRQRDDNTDLIDEGDAKRQNEGKRNSMKDFKILKAFLLLFSKFKSPKSLFKESKLYEIYLEMLMHRDNEIQQLVCNCLKTYKFDYLKPYEEHIDKLFQDNTFRDSLTLFSSSDENAVIQVEHRNGLMNILIRSVISKLFYSFLYSLFFVIHLSVKGTYSSIFQAETFSDERLF